MQKYDVVVGPEAMSDIDMMVEFVRGLYFEETAHKYRKIILHHLDS